MVKSPKIRHSKTSTEPVTIDLGADEVSRIPPESAKPQTPGKDAASSAKPAGAGKPADADVPKQASAAGSDARSGKPASSVPPVRSAQSQPGKPAEPEKPKADTSPQSEPTAARPSAGSTGPSAFGRDAKPATGPEPKAAAASTPPRPMPASRRGAGSVIAAGLIGGLVVLGGAAGAWYGGLLPSAGAPAMPDAQAPDTQAFDALRTEFETVKGELAELRRKPALAGSDAAGLSDANARIESLSVLVEEMRAQLTQLSERAAADGTGGDAAALEEFRTSLSALEERVAALPGESAEADAEALRAEIARIEESVRSAADAASSASEAANATGARIDALEQSHGELSARVEEQDQMPSVALAIAASALKAAIDRGTPFMMELDTFAGLAPDAPEVTALRDMAASGVPTRAQIAAETDAFAVRMIEAGRVIDPQAGVIDRLWASAQSLVTVRPIGQVEGEGVPATVARMEAALDAGDYERAIAEYETLPQDAKAAGGDFIEKVKARHAADRLAEQTLSAALRA